MLRIAVICLLFSFVKSQNCTLSTNELETLKSTLTEAMKFAEEKVGKNEDAIICLGSARAGKSTLINYIIGNSLNGKFVSKFDPIKIEKADKNPGPEIGQGPTSKTKIPSKYVLKDFNNTVIWDSPGFNDNRGELQDISNSFYIFKLLKSVKTLKIVLVVDYSMVQTDDSSQMMTLLNSLKNLFGTNFHRIAPCTTFILSKTPSNKHKNNDYYLEALKSKLTINYIDTTLSISKEEKDFLNYIVTHTERIALFKSANKVGPLAKEDIDFNIINSIRTSEFLQSKFLQNGKPSMSETSNNCLIQTLEIMLINPLFEHLNKVNDEIKKTVDDYEHNVKNSKNLNAIKTDLLKIKDILTKAYAIKNNVIAQLNMFKTINDNIKEIIDSYNTASNIKLIEFLDSLLNRTRKESTDIISNFQLSASISHVNLVLTFVDVENSTQMINQKKKELKTVNESMNNIKEMSEWIKAQANKNNNSKNYELNATQENNSKIPELNATQENNSKIPELNATQQINIKTQVFQTELIVPILSLVSFLIICFFLID